MLKKYNQDSSVKKMVDKMDWVIMPSLNPDGYKYTWNGVIKLVVFSERKTVTNIKLL